MVEPLPLTLAMLVNFLSSPALNTLKWLLSFSEVVTQFKRTALFCLVDWKELRVTGRACSVTATPFKIKLGLVSALANLPKANIDAVVLDPQTYNLNSTVFAEVRPCNSGTVDKSVVG
ncbi:hypothetical protein D3C85_1132380 [compost metagenome]